MGQHQLIWRPAADLVQWLSYALPTSPHAPCMSIHPPPHAHMPLMSTPIHHNLVLGKFGLVQSRAIFAGPETGQSSPWQKFWDRDQDCHRPSISVWSWSRPSPDPVPAHFIYLFIQDQGQQAHVHCGMVWHWHASVYGCTSAIARLPRLHPDGSSQMRKCQ